ncbi:hypothetical protein chiPu_0020005 [Chiloscyllium punctatum]|uniref:Uncharacterized protein n=1 Tax=Chiloscyllium punctatum TaxID=137246 RepID=A0A401RTQ8_CHIPU|nr:hypothetical protein [Chiloscyllium punctatum]
MLANACRGLKGRVSSSGRGSLPWCLTGTSWEKEFPPVSDHERSADLLPGFPKGSGKHDLPHFRLEYSDNIKKEAISGTVSPKGTKKIEEYGDSLGEA